MDKKIIIIFIGVLAASIQAVIGRIAYQSGEINPFSYSMNVLFVSLLIFALVFFIKREPIKNIPKEIWKKLFVLGIVVTTIAMGVYYIGLNYTTAINTAFLIRLQAPFTAFFAFWMIGERLTKKKIVALLIMFVGAYLIIFKLNLIQPNIGDLLILFSAAVIGFGNSYFKKELSTKISITKTMFLRSLFGVPFLILIVILLNRFEAFQALLTIPHLVILQALSYCIYMYGLYYGIREVGAGITTIYFLMSPLLATGLAFFILGESLVMIQGIGALLILIGSYLIIKKPKIK